MKKLPDKRDYVNAKYKYSLEEINEAFLEACKYGDIDKASLLLEKVLLHCLLLISASRVDLRNFTSSPSGQSNKKSVR